jgi:hypothetical protein
MSILATALTGSAMLLLVAAPGEPPIAEHKVPGAAKEAVIRRLDRNVWPNFRRMVVKPSERMPGYVVCGEVSDRLAADPERFERFFVIVPGRLALLDRDGDELIDKYWKLNGC